MLKKVAIQNFIHFREREHLTFEDGPNYIVGGNSTGKSSIVELIRRCLSRTGNTSTSSIPNDDKLAFVLCKFELRSNKCELYTGIFVQKAIANEDRKMFKIVFKSLPNQEIPFERSIYKPPDEVQNEPELLVLRRKNNDKVEEYIRDIMKENKDTGSEESAFGSDDELDISGFFDENNQIPFDSNPAEELLRLLNSKDEFMTCKEKESPCEKELLPLTESFVQVFSLRGIGPLQWNKSRRLNQKNENYDLTDKNAEILNALLHSKQVDLKIKKEIFRELASPLEYVFNKSNGSFSVNYNGVDHKLLKTPAGIIEAMQISLILAHKNYKTICYEEPCNGMHPHMIEKMRDLVLRRKYDKEKVIILISHSPSMVSKWTLDRTYACSRKEVEEQQISHYVIKVDSDKYCKILDRDVLKNILFASSVLFVEGITDKLVMELVFEELLESGREEDRTLQEKIVGMQIILLNGGLTKKKASALATHLGVKYMCLSDLDDGKPRKSAISTKNVQTMLENIDHSKNTETVAKQIYKMFTTDVYERSEISSSETASSKNDHNEFVWKCGEIEDVLCFALFQNIRDSESKKEQIKLLYKLFNAHAYEGSVPRSEGRSTSKENRNEKEHEKNKMKTSVLDFDKENAKQLGKYLVNSEDVKQFLEFMKSH